jgi:hypothetical protein
LRNVALKRAVQEQISNMRRFKSVKGVTSFSRIFLGISPPIAVHTVHSPGAFLRIVEYSGELGEPVDLGKSFCTSLVTFKVPPITGEKIVLHFPFLEMFRLWVPFVPWIGIPDSQMKQ